MQKNLLMPLISMLITDIKMIILLTANFKKSGEIDTTSYW